MAELARDRDRPFHVSDGGGTVRILRMGPDPLVAGGPGRFDFQYEAGPHGIASGGSIFFQAPMWHWTGPNARRGTVFEVHAPRPDLHFEKLAVDPMMVQIRLTGRAMAPGEKLNLSYGTQRQRIRVDRLAERDSAFVFWVDGDGDGLRKLIPDPPRVDIVAGPPDGLSVTMPAIVRPDEPFDLHLAVLDSQGSAGVSFEGELAIEAPPSVEVPERVTLAADARGILQIPAIAREEGVLEIRVHGAGLDATSNPSLVSRDAPQLLWVDLHGHSQLSDGTGTPDDYFAYARDVAGLDGAALTDHDHWGTPFLDETPANWDAIRASVARHHAPGRFVALLGYEWTSWFWGHRHVVHFAADGPLASSHDLETDTPPELWSALRGLPALTFAHHSAGEPVAIDWRVEPDPVLEPITEIASVHGSSESADTPSVVRGALEGNYIRDALDRGYPLGLIGSGDSHDGHPGLSHWVARSGGLAGVYAKERTRAAILEALRARHCYATNGPRILLAVELDGRPMGSRVSAQARALAVRVAAPGELEAVELVADGRVVQREAVEGRSAALSWTLPAGPEGEDSPSFSWLYVRVLQRDGGAAWSSPFFHEDFGRSGAGR